MIEKRILYAVRSSVLPKMTYVYDQKPQVCGRFNPVTGLLDICIDHWKVKKQPPDLTAGEFNRREC